MPETYYFDPPKMQASRIRLALGPSALETLRRYRTCQVEECLAARLVWRNDTPVFSTAIGTALCRNHLAGRDFQTPLKRSGLPRIRLHDLRHTAAALWLEKIPTEVVSRLLGHSSMNVMSTIYMYVTGDMQREATALDKLFA